MRLYFDLSTGRLVAAAGYSSALGRLEFKRGDAARLEVSFTRGAVAAALTGTPTEMVFVVKKSVAALEVALMLADDWTLDAVTGIWSAALPSDTVALTAQLGNSSFVDLLGEFSFTDEAGGPCTSQTIKVRIHNDLWKGTEGTPLSQPSPDAWLAARLAPLTGPAPPEDFSAGEADGLIWDGGEAYPSFGWLRLIGIEEVFRLEGDPEMAVSKGFKAHYSSDGQPTPPVAAVDWLRIHYGFTADYENGSWLADFRYAAGGASTGNSVGGNEATPDLADWSPLGQAVACGVHYAEDNPGTPGNPGQECIVAEADIYKCVRANPVKWVKLGVVE